jgi:ferredoxin-nitrite reductase
MTSDFSSDQKRYLEGFVSGIQAGKLAGGAAKPAPEVSGPDAVHFKAQDETTARGGKLVDQEKWKRAEHPFDAYQRLKAQAAKGEYPKPEDNFRWRYFGLFYVAPAQNSFMCRLRIPNGILTHWQFAGMADLAEKHAGAYAHVTTRANLQIREITAENTIPVIEKIIELGLCSRGSGADNIRNVTGGATAGIDPQELADTRPLAREWHHHILNTRTLYGLPRKFNVAFDGGGAIPTLEESNDIGFQAVMVGDGAGVKPGVWWRIVLGGISGHKDLARATGVFCKADDCTAVAEAMIKVFIAHGDRTNRTKARLKYVLDAWGFEKFIGETETLLGRKLERIPESSIAPRPAFDRMAHIGVHKQKQAGLNWIGITLPVGKLTIPQMRGIASLAAQYGDGDIRLTVWQNLLVSGVPDDHVEVVKAGIAALDLSTSATSIQAGLVACTGATGCKFAAAHTKEDSLTIAAYIEQRMTLDQPVNIHLTGCHHSCAQHYIGDIGLIGAKVPVNDDGDTVEGYDIVVGGGFADNAKIGRELWKGIKAEDAPAKVESLLKAWQANRLVKTESFHAFANRHDNEALKALVEAV